MSVGAVNKQTGGRIPTAGMPAIDDALSATSTNPVQNRVVKAALDGITDGTNIDSFADVESALALKQDKTDNSLQTTDKTVVGAINEHEGDIDSLKSGLTNVQDALTELDVAVNAPDNAGKNLLPFTLASLKALNASGTWEDNVYTKNGVEFTVNTNASGQVVSIVAVGTATGGNADFDLTSNASIPDASKGLLYSGCPSGSATTYGLCRSGAGIIQYGGNDVSWPTTVTAVTTFIRVINEATCDNVTFTPMLRDARISDPTFAPYIPSVDARLDAVESGLTNVTPDIKTITASPDVNGFINLSTYGYSKNSHKYVNAVVVDNNYNIKMWKHSSYGWIVTLYTAETFTRVTDTTVSVDLVVFGIKA